MSFDSLPADNRLDPFGHAALVELLHVRVHLLEVFGQGAVGMAPRYRTELEHRLVGPRFGQTVIIHAREFVKLLPRDHECGQVGSVNGEKHHGE